MTLSFMQKVCGLAVLAGMGAWVPGHSQALSGLYTINPGQPASGNNFQSFTTAAAALNTHGVSGAVSFTVAPGTYSEQIQLNAINGVSAAHTVTFNGAGAILSANPTNTNDRAVIKLNGADYVHINGLQIVATGNTAAEYGYGVQLMNGADYNVISNCSISATKTTDGNAATNYAGIVINSTHGAVLTTGDANSNNNVIENNTISGGYYGIACVAQGIVYRIIGNKILNNTIVDFYRTGIYLNGTVNTVVDHNDISRPGRQGPPFFQYFGMNIDGGNSGMQITRNKLHDPFGELGSLSSSSAYAFYINGSAGDANAENLYANNIIYNMRSNGIVGGFDITSSPYNRFINNTISIEDMGATGYGFTKGFSITGANNQSLYNNNVSISRSSPGAKHCIYISSTTGTSINSNNYYMMPGTGGRLGYLGTDRTTLNDWQGTGFDGSSLSVDPQFTNAGSGNLLPLNTSLQAGVPVAGISTDINGLGRSAVTPTMGAFEIDGVVLPVRMSLLEGKLDGQYKPHLSWSTLAELNNAGFSVQGSADAVTWTDLGFVTTKAPGGNSSNKISYTFAADEILATTAYFRLLQTDRDGQGVYSNIIALHPATHTTSAGVRIYPNPASEVLYLEPAEGTMMGTVVIRNLEGTIVARVVINGKPAKFDIRALAPGIYFVQYNAGNKQVVLKFIKEQ